MKRGSSAGYGHFLISQVSIMFGSDTISCDSIIWWSVSWSRTISLKSVYYHFYWSKAFWITLFWIHLHIKIVNTFLKKLYIYIYKRMINDAYFHFLKICCAYQTLIPVSYVVLNLELLVCSKVISPEALSVLPLNRQSPVFLNVALNWFLLDYLRVPRGSYVFNWFEIIQTI